MKLLRTGLLACATALLFTGAANAEPIDYIFTGTGTGTLNGVSFDGSFTVTEVADTSNVSGPAGGEFTNVASSATFDAGVLSATLTGTTNEVIDNTNAPGFIGFAQFPQVSVEATVNSAFETYELGSALSLTAGAPSVSAVTYTTSVGNLDFDTITSLSFQATTVPEPMTLSLFGAGLAGVGVFRRRRRSVKA